MTLTKRFGSRLRKLRHAAGLSQEQLAERLGVSTETISNLERGIHAPNFLRLEQLANGLQVDVMELFVDLQSG